MHIQCLFVLLCKNTHRNTHIKNTSLQNGSWKFAGIPPQGGGVVEEPQVLPSVTQALLPLVLPPVLQTIVSRSGSMLFKIA